MLQGVVQRGTATRANKIGKPLAGKTGTTNDNYDTWFMGFSPDLVVGTYIGFDRPRSLGPKATGSSVALPVWINFMQTALKDVPAKPFKAPSGLSYEKIDITTGFPPSDYSLPQDVVYEVVNPYVNEIEYSQDYQEYETEKQEAVELFNDYGSYNTGIY